MFKKLMLILTALSFACFAFAMDANTNQALMANDVDPDLVSAPVPNYSPDLMWDVQFDYDIQGLIPPVPHAEDQLLGCEFDGTYFWFTGGGGTGGTRANSLYKFNANGTYVAEYVQSSTSSWGWRDIAWDGTYLYCSEEGNAVSVLDPNAANPGTRINFFNVISPPAFPRAIAYDPVSDHFYGGNFSSGEFEFTRTGQVLRTASFSLSTYGLAWDDDAPDGPWLWLHGQVGTPATTVYQIDPTTFTRTNVSHTFALLGTSTDQIAGGLAYSADWAAQYSTMIAMVQGTPNDRCGGYEMYFIFTPDLEATLTPVNPPINIPGGGGSFRFDAQIVNTTASAMNFDAWTGAILPNGSFYGPIILRTNLSIGASATIIRTGLNQIVPGAAPPGTYNYVGYVGTHPGTIIDSSAFEFLKLPSDGSPSQFTNWSLSGWFGDDQSASAPTQYVLNGAHPNPFNPVTTISFYLPEASVIQLAVFDINGREVSRLLEGWMDSGNHEVVFDGSRLSSGVYFCNLIADGFSSAKKMMLVK